MSIFAGTLDLSISSHWQPVRNSREYSSIIVRHLILWPFVLEAQIKAYAHIMFASIGCYGRGQDVASRFSAHFLGTCTCFVSGAIVPRAGDNSWPDQKGSSRSCPAGFLEKPAFLKGARCAGKSFFSTTSFNDGENSSAKLFF
jgi:hypothetical protein